MLETKLSHLIFKANYRCNCRPISAVNPVYSIFTCVVFALCLEKPCDTFKVTAKYKYGDLLRSSALVFNTIF